MALDLYMIGLTVKDMEKTLEFYRHLGLEVPNTSDNDQPHVQVKMAMSEGFTLFFDTRAFRAEDPSRAEAISGYRVLFEFYLKHQTAVEAKYAELIGLGYQSYRAPFIYNNDMCFALVYDPDGNVILLSGEAEEVA